jgi:hypothetical protein
MVKSSSPAAGSAVHWPAVYAAIAVGLAVVLGLGGLVACSVWLAPEGPAPEPVAQAAPPADGPTSDIDLPFDEPETRPAPRVVAAAPVPPPVPPEPEPMPVRASANEPKAAPVEVVAAPEPVRAVPRPAVSAAKSAWRTDPRMSLATLTLYNEDELREQLERLPELRFDGSTGASARVRDEARAALAKGGKGTLSHPALAVLKTRADLRGLPVLEGTACVMPAAEARGLEASSLRIRRVRLLAARRPPSTVPRSSVSPSEELRATAIYRRELETVARAHKGHDPTGALVQMLQAEVAPTRSSLVTLLGGRPGARSSAALAQRAVFDLSPEVRRSALAALRGRPAVEARPTLLAALRYPWPPAAAHAAEALVALEDRDAVPELKRLLATPPPDQPFRNAAGEMVIREVVRVNHLSNCVMCHAPSFDSHDPVRGLVPEPGKRIPEVYYSARKGDFVRADVTYLRQDFSVLHKVEGAAPWPEWQRFDYLVRARPATTSESAAALAAPTRLRPAEGPYRSAVLFALGRLEDAPRPRE